MAIQVCWLSGNYHERQNAMKSIKARLSNYEMRKWDFEYTFPYLEEQVYNGSCFADKRLFIIKEMPLPVTKDGKIEQKSRPTMLNHLKKLLDGLPEDLIIIFDGIDGEDAIVKHVAKIGKVYDYKNVIDKENAASWVVSHFTECDKTISLEDAQDVVNINGYDPKAKGVGIDTMHLAIKKICLYVGKRKAITKDDVIINAFPSSEFIIWSITDALDSKNIVRCYEAWDRLLTHTVSGGVETAIYTLFAIIQARYRLLAYLKEGLFKNISKAQLRKEASTFVKLKQSGKDFLMVMTPEIVESTGNPQLLWSDFAIQEALDGKYGRGKPLVETYDRRDHLFRILQVIQDAQVEMRYRTTDAGRMLLVDALFFAVCGKMDDTQLATLRKSNDREI